MDSSRRSISRVQFSVDELNSDRVLGWVFDPGRQPDVLIEVDGRPIGKAETGAYRIDVANSLGDERAAQSGFEFRFAPEHFRHADGHRADVVVRLGQAATPATAVPVFRDGASAPRPASHGPLPARVLDLLTAYRPAYAEADWGDEATMGEAVAELGFLIERGPRHVPELHRYLLGLGALWLRAAQVERYFPRENTGAALDAKDRSSLQNSAEEVFCVAAHLTTLHSYGVRGSFAEFGCFKGFSTAILSYGCHQLGLAMHVFDSFEGLPPSESSYYRQGDFTGSLAEVERNVAAYGDPRPVTYHVGFFSDSLPTFDEQQLACIWMDVDLESSSRDVMTILPRLDPRGVVFSHEAPAELFVDGRVTAVAAPEAVVPPIVNAFAADNRPLAGRHMHGNTGAFWDAERGIPPLSTPALFALRDLALSL